MSLVLKLVLIMHVNSHENSLSHWTFPLLCAVTTNLASSVIFTFFWSNLNYLIFPSSLSKNNLQFLKFYMLLEPCIFWGPGHDMILTLYLNFLETIFTECTELPFIILILIPSFSSSCLYNRKVHISIFPVYCNIIIDK